MSKKITKLINHWKPRSLLAEEIGAEVATVHKWASNNRVPAEWQADVINAAAKKGLIGIDHRWMVEAHQREASKVHS